jgi:hypothetical protein
MGFGGPSGSLKSGTNHSFSQVPKAEIPRSQFNRSHGFKTTFDAGYLIPMFVDEALPGDTFSLNASCFARLATPIVPVMDNMYADFFFFAVPYRLVWDNWQKFNGEQEDPGDSTSFTIPQMVSTAVTGYTEMSLSDYFGIPTGIPGLTHSSLWHRAYNLIYNEWFRDQNLQNSVVVDKDDGPDTPSDYVVLRRGKRHDYFTSCLPWPQKGPAVQLPLGTSATVKRVDAFNDGFNLYKTGGNVLAANSTPTIVTGKLTDGVDSITMDPLGGLYADLSTATASTINALRQAFQLQRLYERDARGGTRYTEIIKSHFGVTSPDARLQRPEYLGGGSRPISTTPIPQTSSTDVTTPQGNLAAMGTFSGSNIGFTKSFTEHCLLIGLVSIRADMNYQQGLNRMWSRSTRFDFYWPALSHIGEQAVLNKEIYAQGTGNPTQDAAVFGYQERYAEYRYKPSTITGLFRSQAAASLDIWHLAQDFSALPVLDAGFIVENPPLDRIIATPSEPHFLFDAYIELKTARPMPTYSVPGLIDHF